MNDLKYVPAGSLIDNLSLVPLPDESIPLEAIVLIKVIDPQGRVGWHTRATETLSDFEAVGALDIAHAVWLSGSVDGFVSEWDDEDDGEDD